MYCPVCKKEVAVVTKMVSSKVQYNCSECGVAITLLPYEQSNDSVSELSCVSLSELLSDNGISEVVMTMPMPTCDFGKYKGKSFSDIPTDYLKKTLSKHYSDNPCVLELIDSIVKSRDNEDVNG